MTRGLPIVAFLLLPLSTVSAQSRPEPFRFGILFHVVDADGAAVVDDTWRTQQLEWADRVFAPLNIGFSEVGVRSVPERFADLETRSDRNGLSRGLRRLAINVFVVRTMRDVNDPTQMRRGVHWRMAGDPARHWIVISATHGPPTTLAHELGHFFGVREHSPEPGNIMGYHHGPSPRFDEAQAARVRRVGRGLLESTELREASRVARARARAGSLPRWGRWRPTFIAGYGAGRARRRGRRPPAVVDPSPILAPPPRSMRSRRPGRRG